MNQDRVLQAEKIHLVDFRIIKAQIDSSFDFRIEKIESFHSDLDYEMTFNLANKLVKTDFTAKIETESREQPAKEAGGFFHFAFIFSVENLDELVDQLPEEEGISIHSDLANALASITYSTSRGVLISRFQGTSLQNFILPVINPNSLLK